jgi:hypothetical protein
MNAPHPQALAQAASAISHVLHRIQTAPEVGYYLGVGTESFDRLCHAHAAITGEHFEHVENHFAPQNARDPRKELQERVCDLEERLANRREKRDESYYGPRNLTADQIVEIVQLALTHDSHDPHRCLREIAALFDARDLPIELLATS